MRDPIKVIQVGNSFALIIPVAVCRDLGIARGDFFNILVPDKNVIVFERAVIVREGEPTQPSGDKVPIVNNE